MRLAVGGKGGREAERVMGGLLIGIVINWDCAVYRGRGVVVDGVSGHRGRRIGR